MNTLVRAIKTNSSNVLIELAPYRVADKIDKIAGIKRTVIVLDLDDLDKNNIPTASRLKSYFADSLVSIYRDLGFQAYLLPVSLEEQAL